MLRSTLAALLAALSVGATAPPAPARFDWFEYRGVEPGPAPAAGRYRNPVLPGFYSDPSIVRVGADFYLVTSTFSWFPGIPVFQSRDLVHWRQIGNAISRPGQLSFGHLAMSRGVFAPAISHHDGRFWIINTCVDCGGNYVLTATNPAGPWSDPVWLRDVGGIDPSIFWDDDGRAWIVNNDAPSGTPRYPGHRAIWLHQFDWHAMNTVGTAKVVVDGGVYPERKPVWIEGPHLYKRAGRYYLMDAEGGTSVNHSEVIFSADRVDGPYTPAPPAREPILTQRDLDPARPNPITSAGHADLVDIGGDRWWAVFLATRPYADNLYNTGRETFLLPVSWQDGWPTILPHGEAIPAIAKAPPLPVDTAPTSTSNIERDDFSGPELAPEWVMMRNPDTRWWRLGGGGVSLDPRPVGLGDMGNASFIARRQQQADATATTEVRFAPAEGQAAGLAALQNDEYFLTELLTRRDGRLAVEVRRRAGSAEPRDGVLIASVPVDVAPGAPIRLRLHARGGRYDADWADTNGPWRSAAHDIDGTNLSTEKAGGFVGTMIGLYAVQR
ncbi:MAG: glycoside hydrolase family 43 protein [Janthinobacterium lividum]